MEFEKLLDEHRRDVERFVKFRLPYAADAEDVLQEVYFAAFRQFPSLKSEENFKAWILGIARHKCNDYFRAKAKLSEIPLEEIGEDRLRLGSHGISENHAVRETLGKIGDKEKQILYLFFWKELSQADIAAKLHIPLGTVKSRLYTAKRKFKERYPDFSVPRRGETEMKHLPQLLPDYTIRKSSKPPFAVRHEELAGMLIIPREGETLSFGVYDQPERKLSGLYHMKVMGTVMVHGIRGVEISSQYTGSDGEKEENTIFAQLTDSNCRYLGGMTVEDGVRRITTFLDGDVFSDAYGIGEDNCGFEVNRSVKGIITFCGSAETEGVNAVRGGAETKGINTVCGGAETKGTNTVCGGTGMKGTNAVCGEGLETKESDDVSDIVGRFEVMMNGKVYDTVRLIDLQLAKDSCMMCEYYLDQNGRTVLLRRFNRDDWAIERYGKNWTELLPENERILINGDTYVHWYDCITDYFF